MTKKTITSFAPIIDDTCTVLILGSIPGVASLLKNEYYGHSRNAFWHIMHALLNLPLTKNYATKTAFLLKTRVALWDVIAACERKGSLDSHIKKDSPNDFAALYNKYPNIKHVFFNGTKAFETYRKKVGFDDIHTFAKLPSTSPAHAVPLQKKLEAWQAVITALNG